MATTTQILTQAPTSALVRYESQLLANVNAALRHRATYHTVSHLLTTASLLVAASSIGLYSALSGTSSEDDDVAVVKPRSGVWPMLAQLSQSALSTLALFLLLTALHGVYQYYKPLPALQNLTVAQRQLLGLSTLSHQPSRRSDESAAAKYDYVSGAISGADSLNSIRKRVQPTDDAVKHLHAPTSQQQQPPRTVYYTDSRALLRSPLTGDSAGVPTTPMQLRTPNRNSAVSPYTTTVTSPATITSAQELQHFISEQQHHQQHQQQHAISRQQRLQVPTPGHTQYGGNMSLSPYQTRSPSSFGGQQLIDTPLYSTSVRESVPSLLSHSNSATTTAVGRYDLSDPQADAESVVLAEQLLISLELQHVFFNYCQNARRWLSDYVIKLAHREIAIAYAAMQQLAQMAAQYDAVSMSANEKQLLLDFEHQSDEACLLLSTRYAQQPAVEQYKAIQHWLDVHATMIAQANTPTTSQQQQHAGEVTPRSVRHYVRHRLSELATSDNLSSYRHDGGALSSGAYGSSQYTWTSALPTDAHIVCHCFVTHMGQVIPAFKKYFYTPPAQHPHTHQSLMHLQSSNQHRHRRHASSLTGQLYPAHATLVQTRPPTIAPYYLLTHHKHSSQHQSNESGFSSPHAPTSSNSAQVVEWRAEPGRNNLFAAIALFVYYIERYAEGKIGNTPLKSQVLDGIHRIVQVA